MIPKKFETQTPHAVRVAQGEVGAKTEGTQGTEPTNATLLSGVSALTNPDYHALNVHAGRNDRLLHAVLCAYAKHQLDCPDIGWEQLGNMLMNVICNEIGDDAFVAWGERMKGDDA